MYLENQLDLAIEVGVHEDWFWNMTPGELHARAVVHRRREMREMERTAWAVHHIMAAFVGSKNAPSVDQLLGRVQKTTIKKGSL